MGYWGFFFFFLNLGFWFLWDFGGQWVVVVWGAWWWRGGGDWVLRDEHRGRDRNEREER